MNPDELSWAPPALIPSQCCQFRALWIRNFYYLYSLSLQHKMYSTLQFNKSVRESGVPFEVYLYVSNKPGQTWFHTFLSFFLPSANLQRIGCSRNGEHVMTIDPSSRRYWSAGKHSKVLHESGVFYGPEKRALLLCYLERVGCFLSVVAHRRAAGENRSLQLATWDCNMKKLDEVMICVCCMYFCGGVRLILSTIAAALYRDPQVLGGVCGRTSICHGALRYVDWSNRNGIVISIFLFQIRSIKIFESSLPFADSPVCLTR